jgi:putative hydrolase of the HAD superfamily
MITAGADMSFQFNMPTGPYNEEVPQTRAARAVLFDLDDTLFDHRGASRAALRIVQARHDCFSAWSFDALERVHSRFLEETHADVLTGATTVDAARLERFRRVFRMAGVEMDDDALESTAMTYRRTYLENRRPVDGARALLAALKPRVRIGIVSNNVRDEQEGKLALFGFASFIDELVVSAEVGIAKPDAAIFRIALERLGVAADHAVMIGDSWAADIEGARAAGIRAIWFNPTGQSRTGHASADDTVEELRAFEPLRDVMATILTGSTVPADQCG